MYADDSTLGAAGGTLEVIEQKLKPDICNVVNWCDNNRKAIDYDKTKSHFDNYMPEKESLILL